MATRAKLLPSRSKMKAEDCWDLSSLFKDDASWEEAFSNWEKRITRYEAHRGQLSKSPARAAEFFDFDAELDRLGERLGTYAHLKAAEDTSNSTYQRMLGRYRHAASMAAEAASFCRPELLAIPQARIDRFVRHPSMQQHRITLERLLRYRPHTLSQEEEKLLAMHREVAQGAEQIFRHLTDADLRFGMVRNERGEEVELGHASFSALLHSPSRDVRRTAFHQYYEQFRAHENTLAATLAASVQNDVFLARARAHRSALDMALFPDQVPRRVYDNLIAAVRERLPSVHRYYELRRRKMRLRDLHHYDTYVPILAELESRHSWNQAVAVIIDALQPLGSEYCGTLERGLLGRWCDRYPNRGKHSGAFSSGSYDGDPYILMNYQPTVLDHVFTLAHEAGHSMHSLYSARNQPYQYYNYSIFVAEVASTFNEQLLSRFMLQRASDKRQRAYLVNRDIDAIRATLIRQTMFAEFERTAHELVEAGEPLTVARIKGIYRDLLTDYFGPGFTLDDELTLECLRIPHFYRAFYVYKYATGMSAAIALADRVLQGGKTELDDYLRFLQGGCAKDPLDLLRDAGVDMEKPEPVRSALVHFEELVGELETLL